MFGQKNTLKKYAKKQFKRAVKAGKKRYISKGGPNVKNIYKDVMMLKNLVNVEKKRKDVTLTTPSSLGATAGAGVTGAFNADITPAISQGNDNSTRNGNSLKLVSMCVDIQFGQSVNTNNAVRLRYFIVVNPDNSINKTSSTVLSNLLEVNPFSTVIDYHSSRDAEFFTAYRVIKQGTCMLIPDSITGQISYVQFKIPLKLNHHLKYNVNSSTTTTKNSFYLIVTADTGDAVALTGANILYNIRYYYIDN